MRLALAGIAALLLVAVPATAQLPALPEAPVGLETALSTPVGSADASLQDGAASACADLHADGEAVAGQATGLLPVDAPALPVDRPALPAAGGSFCAEADTNELSAGVSACAEASRVDTSAIGSPVDGASACADATAADGEAEVGGDAHAGPIQQGFRQSVDALKSVWDALRGLF